MSLHPHLFCLLFLELRNDFECSDFPFKHFCLNVEMLQRVMFIPQAKVHQEHAVQLLAIYFGLLYIQASKIFHFAYGLQTIFLYGGQA